MISLSTPVNFLWTVPLCFNNINVCNFFFGNPKDFYFFLGRLLEESLLQSINPASAIKLFACGDATYVFFLIKYERLLCPHIPWCLVSRPYILNQHFPDIPPLFSWLSPAFFFFINIPLLGGCYGSVLTQCIKQALSLFSPRGKYIKPTTVRTTCISKDDVFGKDDNFKNR